MPKVTEPSLPLILSTLSLAALCASCWTAKQEVRITALENQIKEATRTAAETNHGLATLIIELDNRERNASREKYCKEPKIIEFMDAVQAGLPSACTPISMASTLNFLDKIPTACAHLHPNRGLHGLLKTRIGQIRRNLELDKIHSSTRILVMARPAEDSEAGRAIAKDLANKIIDDIVKKALPSPPPAAVAPAAPTAKDSAPRPQEVPVLGPFLLPCELADDMAQLYKKPYFRPIEGEPKLGKPDVVIFVVVSPC